jgi:hypothetical protein
VISWSKLSWSAWMSSWTSTRTSLSTFNLTCQVYE